MIDPLSAALKVAASGLEAQSMRMRVVSENLANAQSTGATPGSDPYQRKTIAFSAELDRLTGASMMEVDRIGRDNAPFRVEYEPDHPAADASGYVKMPNVNMMVELADMREASRSYEADLQIV
jgi:flagellar basal-body rod protein FlgC